MRGREAQQEGALERGRDAYARRAWLEAYDSLAAADASQPLGPGDLELLAIAAYMIGRDGEWVRGHERAQQLYLAASDVERAARCAFWAGLSFGLRGEVGPASGWFARADRLLEQEHLDSSVRGLLLVPQALERMAMHELAAGAALAAEAVAIADRFGDRDLFALAVLTQGQLLALDGRVNEGLALLDEAMLAVTSEDLSPVVAGVVYCAVILACRDVFETRRAREWTVALDRWWQEQPQMVAFTGRCLVHRAEIMQLGGAWREALEEARRACRRFLETNNRAIGLAHYREGELLRLQGDFDAAEQAYRHASQAGWEPLPGLAQLRLAQGRAEVAAAAIRRACAEASDPLKRATLLPAYVEIMLALGEDGDARQACLEFEEVAARYSSAMLDAMVGYARGAVELADGDARSALASLRRALDGWQELAMPYEIARTRVLIGQACRALDDDESCALEFEAAVAAFAALGAAPDLARTREIVGGTTGERHGLSARELEVLRLVATGKSNREIAATLVISERTVARHLQNIFAKLRLSSRTAATAFAFEHGLV
jgi:DNA-binding CsgD family transcriptional regulator/tetratricopeptide (TPR) repeat protein